MTVASDSYRARTSAPAPAKPLVLALHGTGGDENQFFDLAHHLVPGAGVISPRGDVSEMGAARFFRRTGEGVYDMDDLARATAKMIAFITDQRAAHPDTPLYAFGYSNGANILASVLFERPDLLDRVALLHPLIPWQPAPHPGLAGKRVLITAGRRDPITPWPASEALIDWLQDAGATVATHVHDGGHELRSEELEALATHFADTPEAFT
ncbi:MAG: alpha/beta hydrolase [Pseudomonadota bacterium]